MGVDNQRMTTHDHAKNSAQTTATTSQAKAMADPVLARVRAQPISAGLWTARRSASDPVAQLRTATARAAADVANLEQANHSRDVIRALWLRIEVERFVADVQGLLASTTGVADADTMQPIVHAVVERARATLHDAPQISPAALEAAERGDDTGWNAELGPWLAKAG